MSELEPTRTYSNPTATDELRRMLDERGVEYVVDEEYGEKYPPEQRVTWSCDLAGEDMTVTARDYCININDDGSADYCLDLEFHEVFTPEQAIAATLGAGTCHIKPWKVERDTGFFDCMECSECGYVTDVSEWAKATYCAGCGRRIEQ